MTIFKGLEDIVQKDFPLGPMTTFGVGGKARYFVRPRTDDQLRETIERCAEKRLDVHAIGRGSNVLVRDEGVKGAVIQLDAKAFGRITI